MQDRPDPSTLVDTIARFLREVALPRAEGRMAFQMRVAVNALELVSRQLAGGEVAEAAEHERLQGLLGHSGSLHDLNAELSSQIANGVLDGAHERLLQHLWATTMEKLAVDQPAYAAYREELERDSRDAGDSHGFQSSA